MIEADDSISGGWIKLHRCIQDNPVWNDEPFTRGQAWVDLLLIANHQDGTIRRRGIRVSVKRGEVAHAYRTLADRWKWSIGKVQRFMDELKTDGQLHFRTDTESVSVTTLIVITNYERYQSGDTETDTETIRKQVQNKKVKNVKNKTLSDFFEKLWGVYPKKDGRKSAERHYNATVKTDADMERINLALGNYLTHIETNNVDPKFIKNGSTWFNNWTDWETGNGK